MDNYYLKYAEELPYPFPLIKIIKEEHLLIWKNNIIKELSILKNLFLEKYASYIEERIKNAIGAIISIIEQYRYSFLENYLYYLGNEDKLYININDEENTFKLKFLKDIYNSILLLIDNLFSANKLLPLIYQDKLNKIIPKKNSISSNLLIQINNDDFFNKFNLDLEKLQNKLEQYKDIFNFNKNQNSIYPSEEELNKIFEEFNNKNYNKNIELQNKIKKTCNQVVKDKLISKKVDIVIPPNNPEFDELLNISKTIQEIKEEIKDIKEKQNNYCVSSLINKNLEFDEFNKIKESTFQIDGEIEGLKSEIKNYNDKYLKMMNDIEEQNIKYREIQKKNGEINNKINAFINNICN
jgi:hypothetical protein